jgi:hypothetical protein
MYKYGEMVIFWFPRVAGQLYTRTRSPAVKQPELIVGGKKDEQKRLI